MLDFLKLKLDGTPTAAETVRRKRRTLVNAANYAVDLRELREIPITVVRWQKPKVSNQVTPASSPTRSKFGISWRLSPTWVGTGVLVVVGSSASLPRCTSVAFVRQKLSAWPKRTSSFLSKGGDRHFSTGLARRSAGSGPIRGRPTTTAG
ncbi:hypothetical protein [Streptomyces sp. NPDC098101]|uniref:hypothetical protein n=1 Tax=Streptomyces sp. NPDC098101 TaxID=3366096 RepID=UPI003823E683